MKSKSKQSTNPVKAAPPPQQASPIYLLTVSRRAKLGSTLMEKREDALKKRSTAKTFDALVRLGKYPDSETRLHDELLLMGVWGILEPFLTDISVEFLTCFPVGLQSKQFSLEDFARAGSGSSLLRDAAEKEINALSYKTFPEMLKRMQEIFNFADPLDDTLINDLNEIKCTRDVYVHGHGIVNHLYLRKAGVLARERIRHKLPLGQAYLSSAIDKSERFIKEFFAGGPVNYVEFGRVRAFREMWEASCLNKVMTFDAAWDDECPLVDGDEHNVRPKKKALEWCWSHSEKAIFDFLLGVFNPSNETRTTDTMEAMEKFPPSTPEGQMIISWMESPFWF